MGVKRIIIIVSIILLAVIGAMYLFQSNNDSGTGNSASTVAPTSSLTPTPTPEPLRSENIIVSYPHANAEIGLPLIVRGQARTFENVVNVRLSQDDGTVLAEDFTTADAPDIGQFGPFEFQLTYPEPTQQVGIVEVFQNSAKDGSEIDKVTIPVHFAGADAMTIQVFFSSQETQDCEVVQSVQRRIPRTQQTARAALEQLLQGPTTDERNQGLMTQINQGVTIRRLAIENGVARVDFSEELDENVAGSCRVQAIRAQIEQTLLQFPTVNSVEISVDGDSETILQP